VKHWTRACLLSALVLPGLGQVVNRQFGKGMALIGAITLLFIAIFVKVLLDLAAVVGQAYVQTGGQPAGLSLPRVLEGIRHLDMTRLGLLVLMAIAVWAYSIYDAWKVGRYYKPPEGEKDI